MGDGRERAGAAKGDFIAPPEIEGEERDERADALPAQEEFYRPPVRFGSVPVEKEPLGWDRRRGFRRAFPAVRLPFQVVDRVGFGHAGLEPNRLFWGDNLHIMRQLPGESIDLIYIDPPFFSGRQYNVIFGDQNELRSFSDIWQGGMPGYLIWLNARLFEMKRLLKRNGSIYVHCDHHAVHYIKVEMDKIFGYENFVDNIVWHYGTPSGGRVAGNKPVKVHEVMLIYASNYGKHKYNKQRLPYNEKYIKDWFRHEDEDGRMYRTRSRNGEIVRQYLDESPGVPLSNVWSDIMQLYGSTGWFAKKGASEIIGYPTQKPEALIERVINVSSNEGDVVADFFCGGGTTAAVAQRLKRRWITSDQSRVAVSVTADRLVRQVEKISGGVFPVPDFTVEHWGIYEAQQLSKAPPKHFRGFVLRAFGAVIKEHEQGIHGYKGEVPIWVGAPEQESTATAADVRAFANAIRKTTGYEQGGLREGIMLAWAFGPDAIDAAEQLREREQTDVNFIRLDMTRIDSPIFRQHIANLSTMAADYKNFLTFVQPPKVEVGLRRIAPLTYVFDVSDTVVLNAGAKIINVQWDFDYEERFVSTPGYSFAGGKKGEITMEAKHRFAAAGKRRIACRVQDDMGGEALWHKEIEIE